MKHLSTHIINGETMYVCEGTLPVRWHRGREGWSKLGSDVVGGTYEHVSGWWISHCGHPTANWPYVAQSPDGVTQLHTPSGRGFAKLIDAQIAVEDVLTGRMLNAMVSGTRGEK